MLEPSSVNARRWRCGRVQRLAPASTTRTSLHWTAVGMRKTPGQTLTKKRLGAEISRKTQKEPLKVSANCLELCCSFLLIAVYPLSTPSVSRFQAVWPLYSKCTNFQAVWPLYTKCLTVSGAEASLHQVSHGFRRRSFLYSNCTMVSGGRSTSSSSVSSVGMM